MSEPPSGPRRPDRTSIPTRGAIEAQLSAIRNSRSFLKSERLKSFLTFVIEQHLDGNVDQLKETSIALAVFGKTPDFDPATFSLVRTAAKRLRKELKNYYETAGKDDPIFIELPVGGYTPQFTFRPKLEESGTAGALADQSVSITPSRARFSLPVPVVLWLTAGFALLGAAVLSSSWIRQRPRPAPSQEISQTRRLFAGSTSEGQEPVRIHTGRIDQKLLITPDGKKLYAFSTANRGVTVFGVEDLQIKRTFDLPFPAHSASMPARSDRIYISSHTPEAEVMVLDTATDRVVELIRASAPVFGIAVTPDEKKLFLALGRQGINRINLKTRETRTLSAQASPFYLAIDPVLRRLYVSYQGGGPGGRWGHDAVEIYDFDSEQIVGSITDLPMVGGLPVVSPRGDVIVLDGLDACSSTSYDHVGCPVVPSHVFHLWDASRWRVSYPLPPGAQVAAFLPHGTRILLASDHLVVWDWARRTALESMSLPGTNFESVAFSPSGGRTFISNFNVEGLLAFDAEKEECLPPPNGLANLYFG